MVGPLGEAGPVEQAAAWFEDGSGPPSEEASLPIAAPLEVLKRIPAGGSGFKSALRPVEAPAWGAALGDHAFVEWVEPPEDISGVEGPLRVEYTMDVDLTEKVLSRLSAARSRRAHVIVLDVESGRVLAYVSTDDVTFPPNRIYPAASIVKVVTTAAALEHAPEKARVPCRYSGDPYRLKRSQIRPSRSGHRSSLERSLALSNNQCFAKLAVNTVGEEAMLDTLGRFGWLDSPAPGHEAGKVETIEDNFDLGRLGCGLAGCKITPLHAVQLAGTLATGERIAPYWVDRITDAKGRPPGYPPPRGSGSCVERKARKRCSRDVGSHDHSRYGQECFSKFPRPASSR